MSDVRRTGELAEMKKQLEKHALDVEVLCLCLCYCSAGKMRQEMKVGEMCKTQYSESF